MANTVNIDVVNIDTRQAQSSIKALRAELKELKDQMSGLEEGSAPFQTIASRAGEVKHRIDEINETVNAASLDFGDMLSNVTKIGAGVGGVFTIAQSSMQLFGLDTSETTEAIRKLQNLMAIPIGFAAVDSGIKALNKFIAALKTSEEYIGSVKELWTGAIKKMLEANGALGDFADVWAEATFGSDKFKEFWDNEIPQATKNVILLKTVVKRGLEDVGKAFNIVLDCLKAGADTLGALVMRAINRPKQAFFGIIRLLNKSLPAAAIGGAVAASVGIKKAIEKTEQDYKDSLERQQKATEEALEQRRKDWEFTINFQNKLTEQKYGAGSVKAYEEILKSFQKELANVNSEIEAITGAKGLTAAMNKVSQLQAELSLLSPQSAEWYDKLLDVISAQEELDKLQKGIIVGQDTSKGIAEALFEEQKYWNEQILEARKELLKAQAIEDAKGKELTEEEIQRRKNLKILLKSLQKVSDITDKIVKNANGSDERIAHMVKIMQGLDTQFVVANDAFIRFSESDFGFNYSFINALSDIEVAFSNMTNSILENGEKSWGSYVQMASAGVAAVGSLLNSLAQEQDTTTKEGFEQSKKYQISATVMNMLTGIMNAWTSAMLLPFPANYILGAANSALIGGIGAAQIAKIANTKLGDTNAAVSGNAINSTIIPPVDYSRAVQGAQTEGAIRDTRQYVSVVEIDKVQKRVNVSENESRY